MRIPYNHFSIECMKIFLFVLILSFYSFLENSVFALESKKLLEWIDASQKTPYPLLATFEVPWLRKKTTGQIVLFQLPKDLEVKYQNEILGDGFIKAVAVKASVENILEGKIQSLRPITDLEVEQIHDSAFSLQPDPRLTLDQDQKGYVLHGKLGVYFEEDSIDQEFYLDAIKKDIESYWQGKMGDVSFRTEVSVEKHSKTCRISMNFSQANQRILMLPDHIHIHVSENYQVSSVHYDAQLGSTGYWGAISPQKNSQGLYAHEFGHLIGFKDDYIYLVFYDLNGNLLSNQIYRVKILSEPFRQDYGNLVVAPYFCWTTHASENLMANHKTGKVLPEHLHAIVKAY